jgi:hypothetical protein
MSYIHSYIVSHHQVPARNLFGTTHRSVLKSFVVVIGRVILRVIPQIGRRAAYLDGKGEATTCFEGRVHSRCSEVAFVVRTPLRGFAKLARAAPRDSSLFSALSGGRVLTLQQRSLTRVFAVRGSVGAASSQRPCWSLHIRRILQIRCLEPPAVAAITTYLHISDPI